VFNKLLYLLWLLRVEHIYRFEELRALRVEKRVAQSQAYRDPPFHIEVQALGEEV
jgi:hypothetical protein